MNTETKQIKIQREKLKLTREDAREVIWGGYEGFKIIEDEIVDKSRWSIHHRIVIQRESDGKFFADGYRRGATECQDESPYECEDPMFTEVFPVTKTITVYE